MYPLPSGVVPIAASGPPPPRVTMKLEDGTHSNISDPLSLDKQYHTAKIRCNRRVTSPDWYQDVRQIELSFDDEIRCDPSFLLNSGGITGPVTTLETLQSSTRKYHVKMSKVSYQRWAGQTSQIPCIPLIFLYEVCPESLDEYTPTHRHLDQTLPDHLPTSATLRTIFTRYLNINAVPRYGFFEILHHFARNSLEKEKLQEFITLEGAVRSTSLLKLSRMVVIHAIIGGSLRVRTNGA